MTRAKASRRKTANPKLAALMKQREEFEIQLAEAELQAAKSLLEMDNLWSRYVPPPGPFYSDRDGQWIGMEFDDDENRVQGLVTEQQLTAERSKARILCLQNGFAINAIENRISYTIGTGIKITAAPKQKGAEDVPATITKIAESIQEVIDFTFKVNDGFTRQQEKMRRCDRDGESFRRRFVMSDNSIRIRFVEPSAITEQAWSERKTGYAQERSKWGIVTDPRDVETPVAYLTKAETIDADQIYHTKFNVDMNVKRGVPTMYPIGDSLQWAYEVVRRASKLTAIQASIALIRRHSKTSSSQAKVWADSQAVGTRKSPLTGEDVRQYAVREGTILDVGENSDLEFPGIKIRPDLFAGVVQMILRMAAARLTMPEFMFTSDASNANYSSTMVSEGPATKSFQRLQAEHIQEEIAIMEEAIDLQAGRGETGIPTDWRTVVELTAIPPRVEAQDNLQEAQIDEIDMRNEVLSPQTRSQKRNLNFDREQANIDKFRKISQKRNPTETDGKPKPPSASRNGSVKTRA